MSTDDRPDQDLLERIDADVRALLAGHVAVPLDVDLAHALADIRARFAASRPG